MESAPPAPSALQRWIATGSTAAPPPGGPSQPHCCAVSLTCPVRVQRSQNAAARVERVWAERSAFERSSAAWESPATQTTTPRRLRTRRRVDPVEVVPSPLTHACTMPSFSPERAAAGAIAPARFEAEPAPPVQPHHPNITGESTDLGLVTAPPPSAA